jgi:putative beta-barrel porin BBP2
MIPFAVPRFVCFSAMRIMFCSLAMLCALTVRGQDAVRPSLAGEDASEARQTDIQRIPYNLLVGPIRFRVSATMGVEYNDNINYAEVHKEEDFIFHPQVNFNAIWPITQLNTLTLDIGLGYSIYLDHSEANTNGILISPHSQISFDIFVQDFRINIHDRFSVQQDPISEPAISNQVDYGRFENTGGISVLWDLNKVILTLGYDHYTYISTTSDFDYLNRNAEELSGTAAVALSSTTNVGIESYAVFNYYDQNVLNDSTDYAVGGFIESQITNNLRARVAGGYQNINFDSGGTVRDFSDVSDYYVNLLLTHRINAALRQSISAGHENQLGVNSNSIRLNYVRHTVDWNIIRNTLLSTEFFYEDGNESGGFIDEHFHRYGGAVTLGYQFTPHVTLGLRYQYTKKDSDVPLRDYEQNRVSLDGTYSF